MPASYVIQVDAPRGLVSLSFDGIWSERTFDAFEHDLDAERTRMTKAGLSPDWPRVLVDASGFPVQTRVVAARFEARIERFHAERRLAFVVPAAQLMKLQFRRIAAIETHRFFARREDALTWLFAADADAVEHAFV